MNNLSVVRTDGLQNGNMVSLQEHQDQQGFVFRFTGMSCKASKRC